MIYYSTNLAYFAEEREILYYENFNVTDLVTPVKVDVLETLLKQSNYDQTETEFLVSGFTEGFSLGYHGEPKVRITTPNLKFRIGSPTILWNKVMKEVKAGRYAGPFRDIPFEHFIQSPIGLVPKDGGKETRLIFHLFYPRTDESTSVNANMPDELCGVNYPDFNEVIQICLQEGESFYVSRSDMKMAFRNLCMMKKHWCYLVMKAVSPIDQQLYHFFDKCLPFSILCSHFQCFSRAIAHLVSFRTGKPNVGYLDDFLFAALLKAICNNQVKVFMDICDMINFPVNYEKMFWAMTQLVFLGLLIDTVRRLVLIPADKVIRAHMLIDGVINNKSKKITLNQLQKICGFLNFLGRCVIPGRAFTRRLYALTGDTSKLKPHHNIQVKNKMRQDLIM